MKNSKSTPKRDDPSDIALVHDMKASANNVDNQWTRELQETDLDRKRIENTGVAQDIKERRNFAAKAFGLVAVWSLLIYVLLILQGFSVFHFRLPDQVLLAAICSITTLVGILIIVIKYLFPTKK
jgi:hypothetical protein